MLNKSYSIALPLFGALLFAACIQPNSRPYDVPVLLGSNLKQAEAILGKSSPYSPDTTLFCCGGAFWSNPKSDYYVSMMYSSKSKPPQSVVLRPNPNKKSQDLVTILQAGNLSMNDPRYSVTPIYSPLSAVSCYEVIVTPK